MNCKSNKKEVEQKKLDALSAKCLHQKKLDKINGPNVFIDWFVMAVTIFYFPIRYLAKETEYSHHAEIGWEFSAAILFIAVLFKTVFKLQERINKHNKLILANMNLITQANEILNSSNMNEELFRHFMSSANQLESEDIEALGKISDKDKKWSYREAIKAFSTNSDTICPICKSSPWKYKKGECQLCGNTPTTQNKNG
ncbi:MAG: mobilome CxxCx(11)CxxC protein [Methylococcaceae bacterium]